MALFKSLRGKRSNLPSTKTDGYAYFCTDDGTFHIDYTDDSGAVQRKQINAKDAETLAGASLSTILNSSDVEIPTSKAVLNTLGAKIDKANPTGTGSFSLNRKADTTIGTNSVAEGANTTASGDSCHAEGSETIATRLAAHAEGYKTNANFTAAHAEGYETYAGGTASHAEGYQTRVNSDYSHAEGVGTKVYGSQAQHVQGRYNIYDTSCNYAHILGNGTETAESNAHTIDWSGNAWFSGSVKIGGTGDTDPAAKELATKEYVDDSQTWSMIYDSGAITSEVNSISGIDIVGYKSLMVAIKCVNTTNTTSTRAGAVIFNGNNQDYAFNNLFNNLLKNGTTTSGGFAKFKIIDGFIVCETAMRAINAEGILSDVEGEGFDTLAPISGGLIKCTNELTTMTVSSAAQSASHFYGVGSRVIVWGCKA